MCTSPSMPKVAPVEAPPMQQDEKAPDMASRRKRNDTDQRIAGGTLLTGPSGAAPAQTAGTTLLGG